MDDPIFDRVRAIVADKLTVSESEVTPEAALVADLGADSLAIVELGMALEEEFDIQLPDEELDKIKTVGQAVAQIRAKVG